ncbi:MAG: glycosyltransferase [Anaerolineales bacterium]
MADLSKFAVVSYKDDTGLGRQASEFRTVLGIKYQLVAPSTRLPGHSLSPTTDQLLLPDCDDEILLGLLSHLHGIVILERNKWHPNLIQLAKGLGLAVVCVPNWEWFDPRDPAYQLCDLFACLTDYTFFWLRQFGFKNAIRLPIPLDAAGLGPRRIHGPAKLFVHNAGIVDMNDRKSTYEVIRAFADVPRKDIRLIVRMQRRAYLPRVSEDPRIEVRIGNLPDPRLLYIEGDAAIQPSKMEGIGMMVLEPTACGMPVITADYPPMNEHGRGNIFVQTLPSQEIPYPVTKGIRHAHLRIPDKAHLVSMIEWAAENDLITRSSSNLKWARHDLDPQKIKLEWHAAISEIQPSKPIQSRP